MASFVRPSRSELRRLEEEEHLVRDFIEILDERAAALSQTKAGLLRTVAERETGLAKIGRELEKRLDALFRKTGLLDLQRLARTSQDSLRAELVEDYVLGVRYVFPRIAECEIAFAAANSRTILADKVAHDLKRWLVAVSDLSKYEQAERTLSSELVLVRRKLNALRNLTLNEVVSKRKKVKLILAEKERSNWVVKKLVIEKTRKARRTETL